MEWTKVDLHGAASISRVCGVYEVQDLVRVPDGKYKIKVLLRANGTFLAVPNICVRIPSEARTRSSVTRGLVPA